MKQSQLSYEIVEFIPEQIREGVLYVSMRYGTAIHKCCCGCGEEVVTPLNPTDWSIQIEHNKLTLLPSIGNWSFTCQSHYFIKKSKVVWAGRMSQQLIDRGRAYDRRAKAQYFEDVNRKKALSQQAKPSVLQEVWATVKKWWDS